MSGQNNIINEFNEEKARLLVKYLLENDLGCYKKLIPEIELLNYNDFYNLFKGIKYEHDNLYKHDYEDLVMKFNNFSKIIDQYYEEPKYYSALLDLWTNNVCIEDLKEYAERSESFIEKIKVLTDKYEEWPDDFKRDFYKLVRGTKNTIIYKLKETFEKNYNSYYQLTRELINLKRHYEYNQEGKYIVEGSDNLIGSMIGSICLQFICDKFSDYIFNKAKIAKGLLRKSEILSDIKFDIDFFGKNLSPIQIFNSLKKLIENDVGKKKYILELKDHYFEWVSSDKSESYISSSKLGLLCINTEVDTIDGKLDHIDPCVCDEINSFLEDDLSSCGILVASFLNLGWSIYNFMEIDKEFQKLDVYDEDLENIRKDFYNHKKLLKDLPETLKEAINYINHILSLISHDQKRLDDHIKNINEAIQKQESMKNKSKMGMILSGLLGTLSLGKVLYAGSGIIKMFSTGLSIFGGVSHLVNYEKSKDLIIQLQAKLKNAIKLNDEINAFIDKLIKELEKRKKKEIPGFFKFKISDKELEEKKKEKAKTIKLDNRDLKIKKTK